MTDRYMTLSAEDCELCSKLKSMRFSGMAESLEELLRDPNSDLLSFREKAARIINAEWDLRYNKKLNRLIKNAGLKYPQADLDDTIYDPERRLSAETIKKLAECRWIEQKRNLMITGQTGSGKSYMACALAVSALRQFKTVMYSRASRLINDLCRAEQENTRHEALKRIAAYNLLIIDDFGLMQLDINKCRNLFEVLECMDSHGSVMVVSQFPVASWYELFQESTYADACLSRLLNMSYRLEMNGKNMRNLNPQS